MRLFHITATANAEAILKEGFRDVTKEYFKRNYPDPDGLYGSLSEFTEGTGVMVSSGASVFDFFLDELPGSELNQEIDRYQDALDDVMREHGTDIVDFDFNESLIGPPPDRVPQPDYDTLIAIEIPEDVISEFLWRERGEPQFWWNRQFLAPASLLNSYGPPLVVTAIDSAEAKAEAKANQDLSREQERKAINRERRWDWVRESEFVQLTAWFPIAIVNIIVTLSRIRFYIKRD